VISSTRDSKCREPFFKNPFGKTSASSVSKTMPKYSKKRRRKDETEPSLANLTVPSSRHVWEDSIDSVLAEMTGPSVVVAAHPSQQFSGDSVAVSKETVEEELPSLKNDILYDPTLPTPSISSALRERIVVWNRSLKAWQKSPTSCNTGLVLPCMDVEVARHFKVQSLSSFLLEACKELKMPAFERWCVVFEKFRKSKNLLPRTILIPVVSSG
jgi:hypothetical protein